MIKVKIGKLIKKNIIKILKLYHNHVSLLFPNACRFIPTCSVYMTMAIEQKGVIKGSWIGLKRLLKCHPFHPGGYDPLP